MSESDIIRQYPIRRLVTADGRVIDRQTRALKVDDIQALLAADRPVVFVTAALGGTFEWIESGARRFWRDHHAVQQDDGTIRGQRGEFTHEFFASEWPDDDRVVVLLAEVVAEH